MYEGSTEGRVRFKRLGRIVKPRTTQTGYHHISVRGKASDRQQGVCVSRFIYSCFHEDFHPSSHLQIDHLNDNRTDNRLSNLEPITRQQNNKKAQINRDMKRSPAESANRFWQKTAKRKRNYYSRANTNAGSISGDPPPWCILRFIRKTW
jgi:hypothetical protein